LPATSSDDCVSHSFSGEKKPPKVPQTGGVGKRKALLILTFRIGESFVVERRRRCLIASLGHRPRTG
jgi:hypothetical protein